MDYTWGTSSKNGFWHTYTHTRTHTQHPIPGFWELGNGGWWTKKPENKRVTGSWTLGWGGATIPMINKQWSSHLTLLPKQAYLFVIMTPICMNKGCTWTPRRQERTDPGPNLVTSCWKVNVWNILSKIKHPYAGDTGASDWALQNSKHSL